MKELETARKLLQEFDDRLHDLRKTGFGFVVPALVKISVIWVTLVLIGGLRLTEKNYRFFQQAASMRVKVIERTLNLELTETITDKYQMEEMWRYVNYLYLVFVGAAGVLGVAVLYPDTVLVFVQVAVSLLALLAIVQIGNLSRRPLSREERGDWTFSPSECLPREQVRITLTNLEGPGTRIDFSEGEEAWRVMTLDGAEIAIGKFARAGSLNYQDDYEWIWHVPENAEDLYHLQPAKWSSPLRRKILIVKVA